MVFVGEWLKCDDGEFRPIIEVDVIAGDRGLIRGRFLIDSGADRTVLDAALLRKANLPQRPPPSGLSFEGIGGTSPFVLITTELHLTSTDGAVAKMKGDFGAFTDSSAIDLSIIGREILNNFDVIISRRRNQVLLLASNHEYAIKSV